MKDLSFKSFHKFVMWGQEQNKRNPGKFGTTEMYSFLTDGIQLMIYEEKEKESNPEIVLKNVLETLHNMSKTVYEEFDE